MATTTTVSAPGKILLAGGYLVLESPNVGVVIAVDKRFYTTVHLLRSQDEKKTIQIHVKSPQFGEEWKYSLDKETLSLTADPTNRSQNYFVEKTLRVSLLYLMQNKASTGNICELCLTIQADNDFYSLVPHLEERNLDCNLEHALKLPSFLPAAKDKETGKIFKTGLGSSACLVTSLVGALCHALGKPDLIFNLAQISHCHAQGKVGSGFDVSAACNGSHVYTRFPKEDLADLLVLLDREDASTVTVQDSLTKAVESTWEGGVTAPLHMKGLLQVTMADIAGGSESPSMARTVLAWKKKQIEQGKQPVPHWDELIQINQQIVFLLQQIAGLPDFNDDEKRTLAKGSVDAWTSDAFAVNKLSKAAKVLSQLQKTCMESRRQLKAMGDAAGVPIEPDEQTFLADATLRVPGVVAALVPGAGGYDALACLYIDDPVVRQQIGELWANWSNARVCPLTVQAGRYGDGVRVEKSTKSKTSTTTA